MAEFRDPYFDYEHGLLKNRLGETDGERLKAREAELSYARLLSLGESGIKPTRDLVELCAIHKFLFGEIYDWAGKIRTVDIRKSLGNGKFSELFLWAPKIRDGAEYVFSELKSEKYLLGLSHEKFVERLAYFYDQVNYIHPFREGNGRTQRAFFDRLSADAGYILDWTKTDQAENDAASKLAAETRDTTLLIKTFEKVVKEREEK
jgi:cell filamentation protein